MRGEGLEKKRKLIIPPFLMKTTIFRPLSSACFPFLCTLLLDKYILFNNLLLRNVTFIMLSMIVYNFIFSVYATTFI